MRFLLTTSLVIAISAPFAASQSLADLPACAQQAGLVAIQQSGCTITDVACVCSKADVLASLRAAIAQGCSANDQTSALAFANTLCGAAGQSSMVMTPAAATTPAPMPEMSSSTTTAMAPGSTMAASMLVSMSDASVAYTAYVGTSTTTTTHPATGTDSSMVMMMNTTAMHMPTSSGHANMNMSSTGVDGGSISMSASPSMFTGGSLSRASSLEREWVLLALGVVGMIFVVVAS